VTVCLVWRAVKLSISRTPLQIRLHNAPNFNQLYLRHFWTDLLPVFSVIICSSQATKLSTTGVHFRFHLEIPNFKYKICPKAKYNLHFLHNRLEFHNQIFTQNFYILLAAACKAIEQNRLRGNLKDAINFTHFPGRTYTECHKFLTTSTCLSIISIGMQSLVAVLQTVPEIFRKTSQLSTIIARAIFSFYPHSIESMHISSYQLGITTIKISEL